jgi:hypothetical protein
MIRTIIAVVAVAAVVAAAGCGGGGSAGRSGPGMMGGGDMGMSRMMGGTARLGAATMLRVTPQVVAAGRVSLVAQNMGWRTHELVVLPLPAGTAAGQRVPGADGKVDEAGSLGEASADCAA